MVTGDSQEEVIIFRDRQTDRQTHHHNIYIIIIIIFSIQKVEFVDIFPTVVEAAELGEPIQLCPELSNTTLLCTEV